MTATTRFLNPATAPNVPIYVVIDWSIERPKSETHQITVVAYNRDRDCATEWRLHGEITGTIIERPLDSDDIAWLRNIGARP